jgi:hypothetical protein
MTLINKVFRKPLGFSRVLVLFLGSLLGVILWIGGFTLIFWALQQGRTGSEASQFLFIQKPVNPLGELLGNQGFSPQDVQTVRDLPGVNDLSPMDRNGFRAYASLAFPGGRFGTELFLEALPERFLDLPEKAGWGWEEGDPLPILLGREFLNLFNFVFAPSRGFPPLEESALDIVNFDFVFSGNGQYAEISGRIHGLSDRYQTILVPQEFLDWGNRIFTNRKPYPTRLVVDADARLFRREGVEQEGFVVSEESTRLNRLYAIVLSVGSFLGFFSLFLVILIALFNNRSLEVSLLQQKQDIHLLLSLGCPQGSIWRALGLGTFLPQTYGLLAGIGVFFASLMFLNLDQALMAQFPWALGLALLLSALTFLGQGYSLKRKIQAL